MARTFYSNAFVSNFLFISARNEFVGRQTNSSLRRKGRAGAGKREREKYHHAKSNSHTFMAGQNELIIYKIASLCNEIEYNQFIHLTRWYKRVHVYASFFFYVLFRQYLSECIRIFCFQKFGNIQIENVRCGYGDARRTTPRVNSSLFLAL